MEDTDVQAIVKQAIQEFLHEQQAKSEPAYKTELLEERKRREQLERRLGEVEEENKRSRQAAENAERSSAIRAELQRLGVAKVDLASGRCTMASSARRTAVCWRMATRVKCRSRST